MGTKTAKSALKSNIKFNTAALNAWAAGSVESNTLLEKAADVRDGAYSKLMTAARSFAQSSHDAAEWQRAIADQKTRVWLQNPEKYGKILDVKDPKKEGGKQSVTVKGAARNALSTISGAFEHGIDFYSEGEPAEMSYNELRKAVQAARAAARNAELGEDIVAARERVSEALAAVRKLSDRLDDAADINSTAEELEGLAQIVAGVLASNEAQDKGDDEAAVEALKDAA